MPETRPHLRPEPAATAIVVFPMYMGTQNTQKIQGVMRSNCVSTRRGTSSCTSVAQNALQARRRATVFCSREHYAVPYSFPTSPRRAVHTHALQK